MNETSDFKKRCYVVQTWGQPGTEKWLRARRVLKEFIVPACEQTGYEPENFHDDVTTDLVAVNKYHLERAPMVVADLGKPPWNENVMMEVGYRFVAKKPIVLIRDTPNTETEDLPFLLRPYRVIQLPPESADLSEELRTELTQAAIRNIATLIAWEEKKYSSWHSAHAMAVVEIDCKTGLETYIEANRHAERMLSPGTESMLGVPGELIGRRVLSWMPETQVEAFIEDQTRVYKDFFAGDTEVISTIPLAFSDKHPLEEFRGKAFKPIVIQNETFQSDDGAKKFYVRVLYLDVTNSVWVDEDKVIHYAESGKPVLKRKSNFPLATIRFDLTRKESAMIDANPQAWEMLRGVSNSSETAGVDGELRQLMGQTGEQIARDISRWMPKDQVSAFDEDQARVYRELYEGNTQAKSLHPLVFSKRHPIPAYRKRAFRPIIVQHEHLKLQDDSERLYVCVMFQDVTDSVKLRDDRYHYDDCRCPVCETARKTEIAPGDKYDVLLCYHPDGRKFAQSVYDQLSLKFKVWFDLEELRGGDDDAKRAEVALQNAKCVAVIFGDVERREWWDAYHVKPLIAACEDAGTEIIPVLSPVAGTPQIDGLEKSADYVKFQFDTDDDALEKLVDRIRSASKAEKQSRTRSAKKVTKSKKAAGKSETSSETLDSNGGQ